MICLAAELLVDFYTDRKTILMNYSCFSFHVGNKLKPGRNTDGIRGCFVANPFLFNLCPETNGLTERFNQTLSRCLAKTVNDNQENWDEKINTILMGYRASRQASIKHSPYFMLFQVEMRLPIDSDPVSLKKNPGGSY